MSKRGLLIVFSGPSGVGKDTVLNAFLPGAENCVVSISATTRAPREGEEHGKHYFFITREEFGGLVSRGEMLEYTLYNGDYYGTPQKKVEELLMQGKNVILEIEVDGAAQIKSLYPDAVFVFVAPPSWKELERRIHNRQTEPAVKIAARLETARYELSLAKNYNYIIVNDDVSRCCKQLASVVTAAEYEAARMKDFIEEVCSHA